MRYLQYEKQGSDDRSELFGHVLKINDNFTVQVEIQVTDASGAPVHIDNVVCRNSYIPKLNDTTLVVWQEGTPMALGPSATVSDTDVNQTTVVNQPGNIAPGVITSDHIDVGGLTANVIKTGTLDASIVNVINLSASNITAGTISASLISGGTIDASKINVINLSGSSIVAGTITGDRIAAGAISGGSLIIASGAIGTAQIGDATITTVKIASGSITQALIASASIGTAQIQNASITTALIASGAIGNAQIGVASIGTAQIQDAAITTALIATAAITNVQIANATITSVNIASGTITTALINDAAITSAKIANLSVTRAHIENAAITTVQIEDAAITGAKIALATIQEANIASGSIGSVSIRSAAIQSAHIASGSIQSAHIAQAAITTANIQDASITGAKIIELDAGKIQSGFIDVNRISGSSIIGDKIAGNTITGAHIVSQSIQARHITASSITGDLIAAQTISGNNIAAGTITSNLISAIGISGSAIKGGVLTLTAGMTINGASGTTFIDSTGISANAISAGTLDASKITVTNLKADSITAGSLTISPVNLLRNSSFEDYTNGFFDFWALTSDPALALAVSRDAANGYYPTYAVKLSVIGTPASTWAGLKYGSIVTLKSYGKYVLSARFKGSGVGGTFFPMQVYWHLYVNGAYNQDIRLTCPKGTYDWTLAQTTIDVSAYSGQTIELRPQSPGLGADATGTIWIDGVMLQKGSIATEWVASANELIEPGSLTGGQIADGTIQDKNLTTISASRLNAGVINTGLITIANASGSTFIDGGNIYADKITFLGSGGITVITGGVINASAIKIGTIDASLISAKSITSDKFTSTLYGDLNQSIQYAKAHLTNTVFQWTMTQANLNAGTASGVSVSRGFIELTSQNRWDAGLKWDSGLKWDANPVPSGTWTSAVIDIGGNYTAFDSLVFDATVPTGCSAKASVQYSDDNLSWSSWADFLASIRPFRYVRLKFDLYTSDPANLRVTVNSVTYTVSGEVRSEYGNTSIGPSGTFILAFAKPFVNLPSVTVSPMSASAQIATVNAVTTKNATLYLYNLSGAPISGNVNWIATGY